MPYGLRNWEPPKKEHPQGLRFDHFWRSNGEKDAMKNPTNHPPLRSEGSSYWDDPINLISSAVQGLRGSSEWRGISTEQAEAAEQYLLDALCQGTLPRVEGPWLPSPWERERMSKGDYDRLHAIVEAKGNYF